MPLLSLTGDTVATVTIRRISFVQMSYATSWLFEERLLLGVIGIILLVLDLVYFQLVGLSTQASHVIAVQKTRAFIS